MNKYERTPEFVLDLHGHTVSEAKEILDELFEKEKYKHIRIITGKATFRETGPVLRTFVQNYLKRLEVKFDYAKLYDGGEGALEVFLKE